VRNRHILSSSFYDDLERLVDVGVIASGEPSI